MWKTVKEFEEKINELQKEYEGVAALYAANCLLPDGEVVPLIKIRNLEKKYEDIIKE
jgi:hypothetical protein